MGNMISFSVKVISLKGYVELSGSQVLSPPSLACLLNLDQSEW